MNTNNVQNNEDISAALHWRDKALELESQLKEKNSAIKTLEQQVYELEYFKAESAKSTAIRIIGEWIPMSDGRDIAQANKAAGELLDSIRADPEFLNRVDYGTLDRPAMQSIFGRISSRPEHDWIMGRAHSEEEEKAVYPADWPRNRSKMDTAQKCLFIQVHGQKAFLALPQ